MAPMPPRLRTLLAWWRWLLIIAYAAAGAALTAATGVRCLDYNKPLRSQLYEKVTSGVRPRFPSSCGTPLAWQELAARCWAPTPRERPPMEEVKRAMEAVGTAGALGM